MGVILPKIGYKALWKLGVAPKLALNDGQKWFLSVIQKLCDKICKDKVKKIPSNDVKSFGSNMGVKN